MPPCILTNQSTKEGLWGLIQIENSQLKFTIDHNEVHILTPETCGIVELNVTHHIRPLGEVLFSVEFWRLVLGAAVAEAMDCIFRQFPVEPVRLRSSSHDWFIAAMTQTFRGFRAVSDVMVEFKGKIPPRYFAGEKLAGMRTRFSCSTINGRATSR